MNIKNIQQLKTTIEYYFDNNEYMLNNSIKDSTLKITLKEIVDNLDNGTFRISEKINNKWITHQWLKKAIILFLKVMDSELMTWGNTSFFDKCPLKFNKWDNKRFKAAGFRVVPPATVRYGAYIAKNTVIMPSYINIGAYIDIGSMIDTWSTIGSCAQIGKHVHIAGGVGIGGVLEPIQTNPTIIEDNCFIGARSEIAEGVIIEEGSVISMGVFITQSTKIYDRKTSNIYYGRVPAGSVVIPGSLPSPDGRINIACAVIVKQVDSKTINKIKINNLLRNLQ